MIKRISGDEELTGLPLTGIIPQRIRALCTAYGYERSFCRAYAQDADKTFMTLLDNEAVVWATEGTDFCELADFMQMNGFSSVLGDNDVAKGIMRELSVACDVMSVMRFEGAPQPCEADYDPYLCDVADIVNKSFGIDRDAFYLDMSHRIRHGVSRAVLLEHSALVIQHCANGEALLSAVATDPDYRGRGNASRLILGVCAYLAPNKVNLLCEPKLEGFYEHLGFVKESALYGLRPNR